MRIAMIGTGYVGLVTGACFSEFGAEVVCVDKDTDKLARLAAGEMPIFEPGLGDLVARNREAGRLHFTADLADAVAHADAVFIAVGTPSRRGDGHADLSFVYAAAAEIAPALTGYTLVVTKSTAPVGTGREVDTIIRETNPDADFDMCSNPEFLREGAALRDFMRPDRLIIGVESDRARDAMQEIYRPLMRLETPILFTSLETSEMIKYAANSFLATKITFINEMADLCERTGADVQEVARGIGLDARIGERFLQPGPGYGGSCFPKDTVALVRTAEKAGAPLRLVETVIAVNDARKKQMVERIIAACGGSVSGLVIAILGVTFKPDTDDVRDAPSLDIIPGLQAAGAQIRAYDPAGMEQGAALLSDVTWCADAYGAMEQGDAVVLLTEWNQFRGLDLARAKEALKSPVMIDLRNIYNPAELKEAGFTYRSIGRTPLEPPQE